MDKTNQTSDSALVVTIHQPQDHQTLPHQEPIAVKGTIQHYQTLNDLKRSMSQVVLFWQISTDTIWHLHEICTVDALGNFACPSWAPGYSKVQPYRFVVALIQDILDKDALMHSWNQLPTALASATVEITR